MMSSKFLDNKRYTTKEYCNEIESELGSYAGRLLPPQKLMNIIDIFKISRNKLIYKNKYELEDVIKEICDHLRVCINRYKVKVQLPSDEYYAYMIVQYVNDPKESNLRYFGDHYPKWLSIDKCKKVIIKEEYKESVKKYLGDYIYSTEDALKLRFSTNDGEKKVDRKYLESIPSIDRDIIKELVDLDKSYGAMSIRSNYSSSAPTGVKVATLKRFLKTSYVSFLHFGIDLDKKLEFIKENESMLPENCIYSKESIDYTNDFLLSTLVLPFPIIDKKVLANSKIKFDGVLGYKSAYPIHEDLIDIAIETKKKNNQLIEWIPTLMNEVNKSKNIEWKKKVQRELIEALTVKVDGKEMFLPISKHIIRNASEYFVDYNEEYSPLISTYVFQRFDEAYVNQNGLDFDYLELNKRTINQITKNKKENKQSFDITFYVRALRENKNDLFMWALENEMDNIRFMGFYQQLYYQLGEDGELLLRLYEREKRKLDELHAINREKFSPIYKKTYYHLAYKDPAIFFEDLEAKYRPQSLPKEIKDFRYNIKHNKYDYGNIKRLIALGNGKWPIELESYRPAIRKLIENNLNFDEEDYNVIACCKVNNNYKNVDKLIDDYMIGKINKYEFNECLSSFLKDEEFSVSSFYKKIIEMETFPESSVSICEGVNQSNTILMNYLIAKEIGEAYGANVTFVFKKDGEHTNIAVMNYNKREFTFNVNHLFHPSKKNIFTIYHEWEHYAQLKMLENEELSYNALLYAQDNLLRSISPTYYKSTYAYNSFEYNADATAMLKGIEFLGSRFRDRELHEAVVFSKESSTERVLKSSHFRAVHGYRNSRERKTYVDGFNLQSLDIDDLLIKTINNIEDDDYRKRLVEKYKVIGYRFNILEDYTIEAKSVDELYRAMMESTRKADKAMYKEILENMPIKEIIVCCDSSKTPKNKFLQNILGERLVLKNFSSFEAKSTLDGLYSYVCSIDVNNLHKGDMFICTYLLDFITKNENELVTYYSKEAIDDIRIDTLCRYKEVTSCAARKEGGKRGRN